MATAETSGNTDVRLNDLDWQLLEVMADGNRYTQQHLYDDIEALEEHSADWIRQRVSHLYGLGLIQKVGSSRMYVINNTGRAALDVRDQMDADDSPSDLRDRIMDRAAAYSDDAA
jgi:hypothetical protein